MNRYVLKPNILGKTPEIEISEKDYHEAKESQKRVYEAFEIELAFDFVIQNYIDIEKYITEHLILDMTRPNHTEDSIRFQMWGFMRVFSNWLASISFWYDLTESRLIKICGRGREIKSFKEFHEQLRTTEFSYAFLFHMRNYSQHGGFPLTGMSKKSSWNEDFSKLTFETEYTLNYKDISPYFENGANGRNKERTEFGRKIQKYSNGEPFDLKVIIRQSLEALGMIMDKARNLTSERIIEHETIILKIIKNFESSHPHTSKVGLAALPLNEQGLITKQNMCVQIRDEFIIRAHELRARNNPKTLKGIYKRIISN